MNALIFAKLAAIGLIAGFGWVVGRMRWLGDERAEPARVLANAAFYLFAPALLFRTSARLDLAHLPWALLAAFFVPVVGLMGAVYAWQRLWRVRRGLPVAAPSVRAISATFGNTLQIGIPVVAGVFGEAGLGLLLTVIGVHALVLLLVITTLVELDLARSQAGPDSHLASVLLSTLRNAVIHPVVLPVLAGLLWNVAGLPLWGPLDEVLQLLGSAMVPLCLTLIGMTLAYLGLPRQLDGAIAVSLLKLLLQPALVWAVAAGLFGLSGLTLSVLVVAAALPTGSNAMMFAQRYRAQEVETTAVNVLSTLGFAVTAPLWLAALARWNA